MTLVLSNDEIAELLEMPECLARLEDTYRDVGERRAINRPRADLYGPSDDPYERYVFKSMDGLLPRYGVAALRLNSDVIRWEPGPNGIRKDKQPVAPGGTWVGLVLLFSMRTGEPLAILPDGVIQRMRVGATNGLAARVLAPREAHIYALLGSGWQAGAQAMAVCEARKIEKIKVYSPTRANREKFAAETSALVGVEIVPVDSQAEAVRDVDIVITSTNAREPFLGPEALGAGMHMSCKQRDEATDDALKRSKPHVVHHHLLENDATSADLRKYDRPGFELKDHPLKRGIDWKALPTLSDLVVGRTPGRRSDDEITGFVNILGLGAQFAAVGAKVYEAARAQGAGRELPLDWFTQDVHP